MNFGSSLDSAVRAVLANKLRSALTMLGVIIGVGSVIAMIGIGEGTKRKSLEQLEIMGSNRITVMPDWQRGRNAADGQTSLTVDDVKRVRDQVPGAKYVVGVTSGRGQTVKFGSNNHRTNITGADPEIGIILNATKMLDGGWYSLDDDLNMNRVCVLGYEVYDRLYAGETAVGTTVRIRDQNFEVLGVVDYKGGDGRMNPDDQVYMPFSTAAYRLLGSKDRVSYITVQALSSEFLMVTQQDIENVLSQTRRSATGESLFRVFNQAESLDAIQTQSRLLSLLLAGIASVSLLVGGIGIMNIMLVSVTERTREIGLRKAIGAKKQTILSQFMLESLVMCLMGGLIGILLGQWGVQFVAGMLQVPPVVDMTAVGSAFGFASLVGVFFGLYPAIRASNLQPIEALRHE
ncbi:MAG: ABC transporter permease [Fimbriimonadaceae bacterium]|nr:ABC transporter permease [Fimbriimonadaceae bacterium]